MRVTLPALLLAVVATADCDLVLGIEELDGSVGAPHGANDAAPLLDARVDSFAGEAAVDARGRDAPEDAPPRTDAGPSDSGRGDAPCGQLVVAVDPDFSSAPDFQGVFAVAGGLAEWQIAANADVYAAERKKPWYTLADHLQAPRYEVTNVSACVPPGDYALEYWDVIGGGTNNGTPPNNHLPWQIGMSSRTVAVGLEASTTVGLSPTDNDNVPDAGSFYGTWASWSYGACGDGGPCPSGTSCFEGTCYDSAYDVRNCGAGGHGCAGRTCCQSVCVDTGTDTGNCGSCGNACSPGVACVAGACQ